MFPKTAPSVGVKFLTQSNKVVPSFFALLSEPELFMDHLLANLRSKGLYLPKILTVKLVGFYKEKSFLVQRTYLRT